jgi:DNA replication initiation complex subunit (GINS family)
MRLVLHPSVFSDISKIMEYYEQVAIAELADEFYRELRHFIQAAERLESFAIRERDVRRVNLAFK